ncbi:RNA polymerase sigma factor [Marinicella sp. W31]|uniref:RNA polymerase sigma factor n=1 Tax=Marinicella sp. W31 TaxID=3023713 RepID=UPI0037571849
MKNIAATTVLLNGFKAGDQSASNQLLDIYRPLLLKWAHGRVPQQARDYLDTNDVVQDTMVLAFKNQAQLKADGPGEFFCYLRQIFLNQIKQELRKNKPFQVALTTQFTNSEKLAYEDDLNTMITYDAAIEKLNEKEKQAVIMRLEFGLSHQEIADLTDKNSPDAARVYIARAVDKLGKLMLLQKKSD